MKTSELFLKIVQRNLDILQVFSVEQELSDSQINGSLLNI